MAEGGCEIVLKNAPSVLKAEIWNFISDFTNRLGSTNWIHRMRYACHTKIKYVGNTTNFRNHVSRFHPELLATTPAAENANSGPATQRIDATLFSILLIMLSVVFRLC